MRLNFKTIARRYGCFERVETVTQDRLLLSHLLVISLGVLAGLLAVFCLSFVKWDFSSDLQAAHDLGIVSLTVMNDYPKSLDIITYTALLVLPAAGALSFWFIWSRGGRREALAELLPIVATSVAAHGQPKRTLLVAVLACILVSLIYTDFFSTDNAAANWMFLAEEGENLAWVQCIFQGGVYAKDFFCLYGPMLIYPLAGVMKLFGTTVITARVYSWVLDMLAFIIYLSVLNRLIRNRLVFIISTFLFFVMFSNTMILSANATSLRVALGILPLYLLHQWAESNNSYLLFASGVAVGQSLLFSQEVGVCACVAMGGMILSRAFKERSARRLAWQAGILCLGIALSMLPMLSYLSGKGALDAAVKGLYLYPRLVMLGYGGLPFPAIADFFHTPFHLEIFTPLWIIAVYVFTVIVLTVLFALRRVGTTSFFATGLLIFGSLLFRSALGRSDIVHCMFVAPPALMLLFICFDSSIKPVGGGAVPSVRAIRRAGAVSVGLMLLLVFTFTPFIKMLIDGLLKSPKNIDSLRRVDATRSERYRLDRSGVLLDEKSTADFSAIHSFLVSETKPGDYVLFFPNEAAYYFLFDRRNPTRYVISYFAATSGQRMEMVADLERNKPEYVLYSLKTWRADNIPEDVQVPELVDYIGRNYEQYRKIADVVVLRRKWL